MNYNTLESSTQDGMPIYKFLFVKGSDEFRFTSASYFISESTGTYSPEPIDASSISQTGELAKNGVKITLPRTNDLAQLFLGSVPEEITSLTIYRGHDQIDPSEFKVFWKGRVASTEASGDSVTLECEDIFTSMQRPGNRARYQKGCRHALYSSQCGVNRDDFAVGVEVVSQSGDTVTVDVVDDSIGSNIDSNVDSAGAELEPDSFLGGLIELDNGASRAIIGQSGSVITLISAFSDLNLDSVGLPATLYPGCKHNVSDCKNKFNNLDNYGGFPFIPGKNPFANSVNGSIV